MAPKVCVPMDFGRHLLGCPTHNNLKLNTSDSGEVLASSVILSFNSPVIDHMTTTLHMTSVDLLEFSEAGVQLFVDSAYSGTAEGITRGLFRDVNKIANVFEVAWLIGECSKYFNKVADSIKSANYPELLFLFEEAAFIFEHLKKEEFLEVAITFIDKFNWKQQFIDNYLNNADRLSTQKLDLVIELAGSEVELVVQKLTQQLSAVVTQHGLPDYCRYLLDNSDLSLCRKSNGFLFDSLFSVLDALSDNELRWTYALLRKSTNVNSCKITTKDSEKSSKSESTETKFPTNVDPKQTTSKQLTVIPSSNIAFDSKFDCLNDLYKWLHESKIVTNIMMALEIVMTRDTYCAAVHRTETSVSRQSFWEYHRVDPLEMKLDALRQSRGWPRLPSALIGFKAPVKELDYDPDISFLCSLSDVSIDSFMAICSANTASRKKFGEHATLFHIFYFRHPSITMCDLPGRCGFAITNVFGQSNAFMLCTERDDYDLIRDIVHFHQEVQAENIIHIFRSYQYEDSKEIVPFNSRSSDSYSYLSILYKV